MDTTSYHLVDDCSAMQIALKSLLDVDVLLSLPLKDEEELYDAVRTLNLSKHKAVLINVHLQLFRDSRRAECLGLRLFDELLLYLNTKCVPLLLYSPMDVPQLSRWCQQRLLTTTTPWIELSDRLHKAGSGLDKLLFQMEGNWREEISSRIHHWGSLQLDRLVELTATAYAERVHAKVRHSFDILRRAPVRLLLGSELCEGNGSLKKKDELISTLEVLARRQPDPRSPNDCLVPLKSKFYQEILPQARPKLKSPSLSKKLRVLLVDDDWYPAGWKKALDAIFKNWQIHPVPSPTHGLSLKDYDLVLLDYELSSGSTCADWLRHSKSQYPELPVIMLTMSDRVEVALWCLQHGANEYFVKEPYEPTLRNSGEHLGRLLSIIEKLDSKDPGEMLGMWSSNREVRSFIDFIYREKWTAIQEADKIISPIADSSLPWHLSQLMKALLSNYQDFYLSRGATLGSDGALQRLAVARLGYHAEVALELLAKYWWQSNPHNDADIQDGFLKQFGGWQRQWEYLLKHYNNLPLKRSQLSAGGIDKAAHWKSFLPNRQLPGLLNVLELLSNPLLNCVERLGDPYPKAKGVRPPTSIIPQFQPQPAAVNLMNQKRALTHTEHQVLGAEELIRGFCKLSHSRQSESETFLKQLREWSESQYNATDEELVQWIQRLVPQAQELTELRAEFQFPKNSLLRILILDDQPWSPFATAIRMILLAIREAKEIEITAKHPKDVLPTYEALRNYEMVLLDLDMGTTHRPIGDEEGLQWLVELRTKGGDWGTPVAILSARVDSLTLRKSFRCGAVDYIPKRVSGRKDDESCRYTLGHIVRLAQMSADVRSLRFIEQRIRTDIWSTPLKFAGKDSNLWRLREILECKSVVQLDEVEEAVTQSLLSAWCYVYLNFTRKLRLDLWLDHIFSDSRPEEIYLRQAIVDMGCAVEPLMLMARHLDQSLYEDTKNNVSAGTVARRWKQDSGPFTWELTRDLWKYWFARNDCEHGRGSFTAIECEDLLRKLVTTVKTYCEEVSALEPWGGKVDEQEVVCE